MTRPLQGREPGCSVVTSVVTGRTHSGWSLGVLDAVTAGEQARYVDDLGARVTAPVEPLTNYFVGRVRKDLREGNTTLGVIGTAVNRDEGDAELMSLLRSSAYVVVRWK